MRNSGKQTQSECNTHGFPFNTASAEHTARLFFRVLPVRAEEARQDKAMTASNHRSAYQCSRPVPHRPPVPARLSVIRDAVHPSRARGRPETFLPVYNRHRRTRSVAEKGHGPREKGRQLRLQSAFMRITLPEQIVHRRRFREANHAVLGGRRRWVAADRRQWMPC